VKQTKPPSFLLTVLIVAVPVALLVAWAVYAKHRCDAKACPADARRISTIALDCWCAVEAK
jgi:hypothetical protein